MQTDLRLLLLIVGMVLGTFIVFKAFKDRHTKKKPIARNHFEKAIFENNHQTTSAQSDVSLQLGESDPLLEDYEYKTIPIDTETLFSAEVMDEHIVIEAPAKAVKFRPEIITLILIPRDVKEFQGEDLLDVLQHEHYHYGKMNIFHCHENNDPQQAILYSIASLVEPGTFEYDIMSYESYRGIVFWMVFQDSSDSELFEKMLHDAKHLADMLNGTLCDEKRQQLTMHTIKNIRAHIQELQMAEAS